MSTTRPEKNVVYITCDTPCLDLTFGVLYVIILLQKVDKGYQQERFKMNTKNTVEEITYLCACFVWITFNKNDSDCKCEA